MCPGYFNGNNRMQLPLHVSGKRVRPTRTQNWDSLLRFYIYRVVTWNSVGKTSNNFHAENANIQHCGIFKRT